jgi:hypothetical protein
VASRPELDKHRWQKRRTVVRKRDGNRCVRCGSERKLSVHHIVKPQHGGDDSLDNLVTLCSRCHGLQHRKGGWSSRENVSHTAPVWEIPPRFQGRESGRAAGAARCATRVARRVTDAVRGELRNHAATPLVPAQSES